MLFQPFKQIMDKCSEEVWDAVQLSISNQCTFMPKIKPLKLYLEDRASKMCPNECQIKKKWPALMATSLMWEESFGHHYNQSFRPHGSI